MGNFNDGFWNLFIVVCTLGGIFAMYLLTAMNSRAASPRTTEADTMQPHAGSSRGDRPGGDGGVETMGHVWDEDLTELNNPLPRWWVILFYVTLVFGVLYLVLYPGLGSNAMLLGWTQVEEYEAEMARAEARYGPITRSSQTCRSNRWPPIRGRCGSASGSSRATAPYATAPTRAACPASRTCATTPGSGEASRSRSGPASSPAAMR